MTMPTDMEDAARLVLAEVHEEMRRQYVKWGDQKKHPDGTGGNYMHMLAEEARELCEEAFEAGEGTWMDILNEEVYEAFAEEDITKLREELVQVAAVTTSWISAIDRRYND